MKIRGRLAISLICLGILIDSGCRLKETDEQPTATTAAAAQSKSMPGPAPRSKLRPLVAFLKDGNLWVTESDGANHRLMATPPEGEAIQDFVWSWDGSRIYYSIGFKFFEALIQTANIASTGCLNPPPGMEIERLELSCDGRKMIVHLMAPNAGSQLMVLPIGESGGRELMADEYTALLPPRGQVVRNIGDYSVSPDGRQILFKQLVGLGEELFVANAESGARLQITHLYEMTGFEGSVETEGGRRVIEAAWSPDGRYVIFNPMQSCSEVGLCYGRLYLVENGGGPQYQLSTSMMVNVAQEWNNAGDLLVYDDGSQVVVTDTAGRSKGLGEGNRPKWQPIP
jgi:Tol biopolymer transport system component